VRCDECGFEVDSVVPGEAAQTLRGFGRRYRAPLTRLLSGEDDSVLRRRPDPSTWSALEYAGHIRDVFALFGRRIDRMVADGDPDLEVIDHDVAVQEGRYCEADPAAMADDIAVQAESLAATVDRLGPTDWVRTGRRGGEVRTVDEVVRRALHEGHHHLLDVGRTLRRVRATA
jgi:DinB family protein